MFFLEDASLACYIPGSKPFDAVHYCRHLEEAPCDCAAASLAGLEYSTQDPALGAFQLVEDLL